MPTPKIDLSELAIEDLEKLHAEIQERLDALRAERRKEAFAALEAKAQELGISKEELANRYGGRPRRRSSHPALPKYRDPADPSKTWSGRGRKPAWVQAHLDKGGKIEQLQIGSKHNSD